MPRRLDTSNADFARDFRALIHAGRGEADDVDTAVAAILADVRARGDAAVSDYTQHFDGVTGPLRIPIEMLDQALAETPPAARDALELAASRIEGFHRAQMPGDLDYRDALGVRLGLRWTPVEAVGLYVPGGAAAYPSSVLMNAVPARVAGVRRLAMTVPTPAGAFDPLVFAAARLAGIEEVYRIGGAQAVGALAFGTASIPSVDKIVGPGNVWVAAAKRQVYGHVGIDTIAGPSEVLVVWDGCCPPAWIAADLLAQAEHDEAAQSILITLSHDKADAVETEVDNHLETLPRAATARASWERHGACIIVQDLEKAPALINSLAPEHLQLAVSDPEALAMRVRHAGAVFLGPMTPEAIGDYVGGPNHVLPTSRTARFASGLGVMDFMKRTTLLGCTADSLATLGPAATALAAAEGLDAHGLSVSLRING
ncbi:MAG: histidinol dehydrogenase [Alphaproteobacteria bacterium]|nr:histidinol dehydrogenase [Alphaproteobacteria bacterium]MCY4319980.1 histidinol dehydrogenase [Alphaproteobacteria bacterium]